MLRAGGIGGGGLNFDAKIRRQSIDPDDLLHAHVGAIDLCARALEIAARMLEHDELASRVAARYAGWDGELGRSILSGEQSLADLTALVETDGLDPQPRSGAQERFENLLNTYF